MNIKKVKMIDSDGNNKSYGDVTPKTGNNEEIICLGYSPYDGYCPVDNTLVSLIASTTRNNLDNPVNPTSGNKFSIGSEQFVTVGNTSPTFNRMSAAYAFFIPTKLINLVGTKYEYEALILLKVGEFWPTVTNCSVPKFNLFPEVGFTGLFKLFLVVLAITLTNVFSSGHDPSFGV